MPQEKYSALMFQISISQNTVCIEMVNFRKDGHL